MEMEMGMAFNQISKLVPGGVYLLFAQELPLRPLLLGGATGGVLCFKGSSAA
jgi:hypothetical protein